MKRSLSTALAVSSGLALAALAASASAQETTVIRHEKHVETTTVTEPQPETTVQTRTRAVTHHRTVATHRAYSAVAVHHPKRRHVVRHRAVKAAVTTDTETTETRQAPAVTHSRSTLVDHKTVIHRDDEGNVVRRDRVTRTHPDGTTTTTVKHSRDDAPPPRDPEPDPDPHA
jgi:hypothetical protein